MSLWYPVPTYGSFFSVSLWDFYTILSSDPVAYISSSITNWSILHVCSTNGSGDLMQQIWILKVTGCFCKHHLELTPLNYLSQLLRSIGKATSTLCMWNGFVRKRQVLWIDTPRVKRLRVRLFSQEAPWEICWELLWRQRLHTQGE